IFDDQAKIYSNSVIKIISAAIEVAKTLHWDNCAAFLSSRYFPERISLEHELNFVTLSGDVCLRSFALDIVDESNSQNSLRATNYRFGASVVACARWEEHYIVEWLNYYRAIGFDHIYLYCNDDDPLKLFEAVLPFTSGPDPFVTFHFFPLQGQQHLMYLHFLKNYKNETEWMTFLDIDEFLRLPSQIKIKNFLQEFPGNPDSIYFNWCFFGNNGHNTRPSGSVLLNYTKRFNGFYNRMTKHITRSAVIDPNLIHRGSSTDFWHYWHGISTFSSLQVVNVLGDDMHGYYDDPDKTDAYLATDGRLEAMLARGIVNHYVYKSREDFLIRARRGTQSVFAQQAWYEQAYHSGQVDDVMRRLNQVDDFTLSDFWHRYLARASKTNIFSIPEGQLLSLKKHATQSSISEHSRFQNVEDDASGAVDGLIDGDYSFHTGTELNPWWMVDLGRACDISEIVIYNRVDHRNLAARCIQIKVEVRGIVGDWVEIFRKDDDRIFGGADGDPLHIRLNHGVTGQWVKITLLSVGCLHFDQIQVFGSPKDNISTPQLTEEYARNENKKERLNLALNRPATQSSTSPWSRSPTPEQDAAGAVDGHPVGMAKFHTNIEANPWWRVDLGGQFSITEVKIYNRLDQPSVAERASKISVEIGWDENNFVRVFQRMADEPFGGIDGNPLIIVLGRPITGRFVRVMLLSRNYLHLDQVEVYGEAVAFTQQLGGNFNLAD
ncbi:MAG TPA: discoidin domain-containing protein, partial [Acetobacteraceae bacterium]|nr:discoidin domain-containing protein [Acetobacteraceae bacterium]